MFAGHVCISVYNVHLFVIVSSTGMRLFLGMTTYTFTVLDQLKGSK